MTDQEHSAESTSWQSLSKEQQQGILEAFEESEDESNLISFDEIKSKYENWPVLSKPRQNK